MVAQKCDGECIMPDAFETANKNMGSPLLWSARTGPHVGTGDLSPLLTSKGLPKQGHLEFVKEFGAPVARGFGVWAA
jgi:hypothetical protein